MGIKSNEKGKEMENEAQQVLDKLKLSYKSQYSVGGICSWRPDFLITLPSGKKIIIECKNAKEENAEIAAKELVAMFYDLKEHLCDYFNSDVLFIAVHPHSRSKDYFDNWKINGTALLHSLGVKTISIDKLEDFLQGLL